MIAVFIHSIGSYDYHRNIAAREAEELAAQEAYGMS